MDDLESKAGEFGIYDLSGFYQSKLFKDKRWLLLVALSRLHTSRVGTERSVATKLAVQCRIASRGQGYG